MCRFLSALVLRGGRVICNPLVDSHSTLMQLNDIHERDGVGGDLQNYVRLELTPPESPSASFGGGMPDYKNWRLRVDESEIPSWWDNELEVKVRQQLTAVLQAMEFPGPALPSFITGGPHVLSGDMSRVRGICLARIMGSRVSLALECTTVESTSVHATALRVEKLDRCTFISCAFDCGQLSGTHPAWVPPGKPDDVPAVRYSRFGTCNLSEVLVSALWLQELQLSYCNAASLVFDSCRLTDCIIQRTNATSLSLLRCAVSGLQLVRCQLACMRICENTTLHNSHIDECNAPRSLFTSEMGDCRITGCRLANSFFGRQDRAVVFRDTYFRRCDLSGALFAKNLKLTDVFFEDCDLSGVDFRDVDLSRCTFRGCRWDVGNPPWMTRAKMSGTLHVQSNLLELAQHQTKTETINPVPA